MMTVLPTPAPPKRPTLPPLLYGSRRSTTLMPVSRTSVFGVLIFEPRRRPVNGIGLFRLDRAHLVDRFAQHVDQPSECLAADRHGDRRPRILHIHPARETVGRGHRDAADAVFTKVQRDFKGDADGRRAGGLILFLNHFEGVVNVRQLSGRKLHVHHRSDDLNDFSCAHTLLLPSSEF